MDETKELSPDLTEEDEALNPFYGSATEILNRYNRCNLCGSHLHFSHSTDFVRNLTIETAKCPECGVKMRRLMHRLQ